MRLSILHNNYKLLFFVYAQNRKEQLVSISLKISHLEYHYLKLYVILKYKDYIY